MPNSTPENLISIIPQMEIPSICRTLPSRFSRSWPRRNRSKVSLKTADLSPKINGPSASFCHILGRKGGSDREGHFHPSNCHRMWRQYMEESGSGSKPRASSSIPGKAHQERKRRRSDQGNAFFTSKFCQRCTYDKKRGKSVWHEMSYLPCQKTPKISHN